MSEKKSRKSEKVLEQQLEVKPVDSSETVDIIANSESSGGYTDGSSKSKPKTKKECTPEMLERLAKMREAKAKKREEQGGSTRYQAKKLKDPEATLRQILSRIDKIERRTDPKTIRNVKVEEPEKPEIPPVEKIEKPVEIEKKVPVKEDKPEEIRAPIERQQSELPTNKYLACLAKKKQTIKFI